MNKTMFNMMLIGPAGSGKSTFVAGMSEIDIYPYISAGECGGANTTKLTVTYEFNNNVTDINVTDCLPLGEHSRESIIEELLMLKNQTDGRKKLFDQLNSSDFAKKCSNVSLVLPIKKDYFSTNDVFESIVLIDSRGLGDVEKGVDIDDALEKIGITTDINAILFFSISSIQQPVVFSQIIDEVQKNNLKTPMFFLRRDEDTTINDQNFKETIEKNIKNSDPDLYHAVSRLDVSSYNYMINEFVFNVPEVKIWKGAINVDSKDTTSEINQFNLAIKEVLDYSIEMYNELYNVITSKLNEQYQEMFTQEVLNELTSEKALNIVSKITTYPHTRPSDSFYTDRDTQALASPPNVGSRIGIEPFIYEKHTRGNQYADGIIPSYSYSCVNFRAVFRKITRTLTQNYKLRPLFSTFMDIVLSEQTVTTYTGYTFSNTRQDAIHFDKFLHVRGVSTDFLRNSKLVNQKDEWQSFSYTPIGVKYSHNEAIAVLMYLKLIESFDLATSFKKYKALDITDTCIEYVVENDDSKIKKKISRLS